MSNQPLNQKQLKISNPHIISIQRPTQHQKQDHTNRQKHCNTKGSMKILNSSYKVESKDIETD